MPIPTFETIASYLSIIFAVTGAIVAGFWLALVIWAFRDMRLRSRDPFAQILAGVVAALQLVGPALYFILRPPEHLPNGMNAHLEEEACFKKSKNVHDATNARARSMRRGPFARRVW